MMRRQQGQQNVWFQIKQSKNKRSWQIDTLLNKNVYLRDQYINKELIAQTLILIHNIVQFTRMLPTRAKLVFLPLIILLAGQLAHVNCINTPCELNGICPANSACGVRGICVCDTGFIINCNISALALSGVPVPSVVSSTEAYYTIEPQLLYEFIKFQVQITTTQNQTAALTVDFWGDTGKIEDLTTYPKIQVLNIELNATSPAIIQTTYFQFSMQPNGQPQRLIIGLQIASSNLTSIPVNLTLQQVPAYNENIFKIILTVLMGILSVSCLIMLGFCIYRRKRMNEMRQRAIQEKEVKPTDHFDQYMPKVPASRVNIPLQVCSVCLTDITIDNEVRLTICKHIFHADCIDSWCKKNTSCPICRQQLDLESCQNILGQDFDLSESLSARKMDQSHPKEVEMMNKRSHMNESHTNEEVINNRNPMRSPML